MCLSARFRAVAVAILFSDKCPLAMLAHFEWILRIGQAQRKQKTNRQHQRMKVPDHHRMFPQFQMIARHIPIKARDTLPI